MAQSLITKQKNHGEREGNILFIVKHLAMVLKRTISMRRVPSSYVLVDKKERSSSDKAYIFPSWHD